ncbi:Zn-dependent hydrolase [Sutterella sp.]|uniref:Zn-dependent hydrolase n=1 Tax=Sutterella sp. TaxID=1981025 RepID=UPI0026DEDA3C|nr:Zn-dependent hydrolase [Sutterella sp.]MDO5531634.1 Zn-dependent hydrolase [Sutterella sp.]
MTTETLMRDGAKEFARKTFDDIREFSRDHVIGVSRQGYGPKENMVHDYVRRWADSLGLEVKVDRCGNMFVTLAGEDRTLPCYMTGSHGDSVPQGGHYDGLAGVVAGMTAIQWMHDIGFKPKRDVTLVVFRMEESSWFGKAYVGSLAMTGQLTREDLALKHRSKDQTLAEAVREAGFDPEDMVRTEPSIDLKRIAAFTELHIEQGPTLDSDEKHRVGIVTGIRGNFRHKRCVCTGVTAHSGAVDRQYRHDAVMAMASMLHRMEEHWAEWLVRGEDLVFTVGVFNTAPSAAIAIIPGEVSFSVDIRSLSEDTLKRFHRLLESECSVAADDRGVKFDFDRLLVCEPAKLDKNLVTHLMTSAEKAGIPARYIPSGAGHDSAVLANLGVPASMIFVANQDGSHNPHEKMKLEDFMLGAEVLFTAIRDFD